MAISTNGVMLTRLAGALYGQQLDNNTYKEVVDANTTAAQLNTWANSAVSADFGTKTDLQVATILIGNVGLSSVAGLDNWVAAQLTAAGTANRGAKIISLLNDYSQMSTTEAIYGASVDAFNTKVGQALALSQTSGNAGGTYAAVGVVVPTAKTYAFTTGVDAFVGTALNDTFTGIPSSLDTVDGGAGTDTLTFSSTSAIDTSSAVSYTVTGIETAALTSTSTLTANTSTWTGLTSLTTASIGTTAVTAAVTTDTVVTASNVAATTMSVSGGKALTVTAAGVTTGGTIAIGSSTTAGAITATVSEINTTAVTGNAVTVAGGTTVALTKNITAGTAVDATGGSITVNGGAATTSVSVTQTAASTGAGATAAVAAVTEVATMTGASGLLAGQVYTVAGLTFTATGAVTQAQLLTAFASLADGATRGSQTALGTYSGTLTDIQQAQ